MSLSFSESALSFFASWSDASCIVLIAGAHSFPLVLDLFETEDLGSE